MEIELPLDCPEAALELLCGRCQGHLGMHADVASHIADAEQQVDEFVAAGGCIAAGKGFVDFAQFLAELGPRSLWVGLVEPGARRLFADAKGPPAKTLRVPGPSACLLRSQVR